MISATQVLLAAGHATLRIVVRVALEKTASSFPDKVQISTFVEMLPGIFTISSTIDGCILGIDVGDADGPTVGLSEGYIFERSMQVV